MTPERFEQIERVCQAALDLPDAEREAFLDEACHGDPDLRAEVAALLADPAPGGTAFLDTPAWPRAAPALLAGQRLGPYEVTGPIGAGGMGEVYKARDTRLARTVAIKVLASELSADPDPSTGSGSARAMSRADRRARFEREATTIAGLNHPNICTLHDVGDHDGSMFLVMEHIPGETLAARLEKGRLPVEQALTIATEIADALSAAHRQGVIHRDLKPANVMLTRMGGGSTSSLQAKLLDFGLAKLTGHGEQPAASHAGAAVAQAATLTGQGVIVGTLQYMAPEQLEGKTPDARTDLWALGAILYEMVTGKRAFEGTSAASLMAAIMDRQPPPVATLQPLAPPLLDRLVRQCLAKLPDDRPDSAHDVATELCWLRESSGTGPTPDRAPVRRRRFGMTLPIAGIALLVGAVAGGGALWFLRPARAPMVTRVTMEVRPAEDLNSGGLASLWVPTPGGSRTALTWTPDGRTLLFVGRRGGAQQLYARRLEAAEARPLSGTEGARTPAVSPDGQWVAFWAAGALRKAPLAGGPPMDLAAGIVLAPSGLAWDARAGLVFSGGPFYAVHAIPAEGGKPTAITTVGKGEIEHISPSLLPGGRVLLYTVRKRIWTWGDEEVVAQVLATGERKRLLTDAVDARYVPATGHLVFLRRGVLYAVPFDAERLETRGTPTAVFGGIAQALNAGDTADVTGAGQFALATTGTLAWLAGPARPLRQSWLVTVDRRGRVAPLPAPVRSYAIVRVSPDGHRLAVTCDTLTDVGLWLYDLTRTTLTRLPVEGEVEFPTWTPDGRQLVFQWLNDGTWNLASQPADGTAPTRLLGGDFMPSSWAPDGQTLAAVRGGDVHLLSVTDGKANVRPLWETPRDERGPVFSPDGRWLAYGSNESGRHEIYVRPYPGPGPAEQVSIEGGTSPAWHPAGRELFFADRRDAAGMRRMMSAVFVAGTPPRIGRPRPLFAFDPRELSLGCSPARCYDVAPDGERFYAVQYRPSPPPPVTHVNLIQNWFEELKAKVPPAR